MKTEEKRSAKEEREYQVLLGLIEQYLITGKAVGSNTLKETDFKKLSSATIRNYFSSLEEQGFLMQQHASGGRIPTAKGFRAYASENRDCTQVDASVREKFDVLRMTTTQEITAFLERSAEILSETTGLAVFLSAPRFDHDYIIDIKVVGIDSNRCLCVLITNFGVIRTEVMHADIKLSAFAVKRIESYFYWRLTGHDKPQEMQKEEEALAKRFYNEVIVRYIVGYAHFNEYELYRTGFSKLLQYPEFETAQTVAQALSLFENRHKMGLMLTECTKMNTLKFWIGEDLQPYLPGPKNCTVVCYPYYVGQTAVGAVGILGPTRVPYKELFATLKQFSTDVSEALTRNLYKYQLDYRKPQEGPLLLQHEEQQLIAGKSPVLLEDKRENS